MVRHRKHHFSLIIVLFIGQWLMGQVCDYASMEKLLNEAKSLNLQDYPNPEDLQSVTNDLDTMLITCAEKEFPGKESLKYQYHENLVDMCKKLGDIVGQMRHLNRLKDHSISDEKSSNIIDERIAFIEQDYGPLRIRFEGTTLKEMATLKTTEGAQHVSINILPPANAWDMDEITDEERKERRERLKFIQKKSLEGDLEVFFDSYDSDEDYERRKDWHDWLFGYANLEACQDPLIDIDEILPEYENQKEIIKNVIGILYRNRNK